MENRTESKPNWMQRRLEQLQLKRERRGDSPETLAERHTPKRDWIDMWLWSSGIQRPNRFKN